MVSFDPNVLAAGTATIYDVMRHLNHIRQVAGVDHVGIGAGYDSASVTPVGLEDVTFYPALFDLLAIPDDSYNDFTPWTFDELKKLSGENFLRVLRAVEDTAQTLSSEATVEDLIPSADIYSFNPIQTCKSDFTYVPNFYY